VVVVKDVDLAALQARGGLFGGPLLAAGVIAELFACSEVLHADVRMVRPDAPGAAGAAECAAHIVPLNRRSACRGCRYLSLLLSLYAFFTFFASFFTLSLEQFKKKYLHPLQNPVFSA
jgi:hypothetical protein